MRGHVMNFHWGDSPMSWLRYMTLASFRKHNPDREMRLHMTPVTAKGAWGNEADDEQYEGEDWRPHLPELGVKVYDAMPLKGVPPQHMGDICRWSVLSRGGLYSDMDILWIAPMPEIEGDAVSCRNGVLKLGLASGAKDGIFGRVLELALASLDATSYQSVGVGPLYELAFGRKLGHVNEAYGRGTIERLGIANIPMWWVHPLEPAAIEHVDCPECIGLHWYGGLAFSAQTSRTMTPDNWESFPGAIPSALSKGAL